MADRTFNETDICSLCSTLERACEDYFCKKPPRLGRKPEAGPE